MKINSIKILSLLYLLLFLPSCSHNDCKKNAVFNKFSPETKEYKAELVKQLKLTDKKKITYRFLALFERDSLQFILVSIEGGGLCAIAPLKIEKWDSVIEGIQKSKGKGYLNAEFKNLEFKISEDSLENEFIYQSVGAIID